MIHLNQNNIKVSAINGIFSVPNLDSFVLKNLLEVTDEPDQAAEYFPTPPRSPSVPLLLLHWADLTRGRPWFEKDHPLVLWAPLASGQDPPREVMRTPTSAGSPA